MTLVIDAEEGILGLGEVRGDINVNGEVVTNS